MNEEKINLDLLKVFGILTTCAVLFRLVSSVFQWCLHQEQKNPVLFWGAVLGAVVVFAFLIFKFAKKKYLAWKEKRQITNGKGEDSVFAGVDEKRKGIFINLSFRRMHTQVVGTTNAGKTESVIVPWMIDDIEKGRGLVFIDGKSDIHLLNKVYSYVCQSGRENDFKVLSLSQEKLSHTYNPLLGQPSQVTEKVINSFQIENEYFRTVQFEILRNVLEIFNEAKLLPNFFKIRQAITNPSELLKISPILTTGYLKDWVVEFNNIGKDKRRDLTSGLVSNLGFFCSSEHSSLFNSNEPSIDITKAMEQNQIIYFQLPVLQSPVLGKSVAKIVLQDIQNAVSKRHASGKMKHNFFSVYLDDFTEYLTPQFVSLLNKSRSANVGVVFAHQAIGDLEALGAEIKNQILTNSNLKIFMRTNEPDSAEYFSKVVGTKDGEKVTVRQKESLLGSQLTGDGSVREVEEFIYHPNIFKRELGLGEAIMVLPHKAGSKSVKIKFAIRPDLPVVTLPEVRKEKSEELISVGANFSQGQSLASLAVFGAGYES